MSQWKQVALISGSYDVRFFIAGLSPDGKHCLVTDITCIGFDIYNVDTGVILSHEHENRLDYNSLIHAEYLIIPDGIYKGKYRLFGGDDNHPLVESPIADIKLTINKQDQQIVLATRGDNVEFQKLSYEAFSYDWVSATFSDDGSTIAVIEPIYITFFREVSDPE